MVLGLPSSHGVPAGLFRMVEHWLAPLHTELKVQSVPWMQTVPAARKDHSVVELFGSQTWQ
jgi:hypothetical protein